MPHDPLKITTRVFLLALAYFITGWLGLRLPALGSHITLIWLPTGIAVGSLLRWGNGCWPGVTLGALAVNLANGMPWLAASGIAAGNTLGPLLAATALRRMGIHAAFDRRRDILILAAGGVLGMAVSSGIGTATLSLAGLLPDGRAAAWLTWWAGDAMGVIAAAPPVLTFTRREWHSILLRGGEFLLWACATFLAAWTVFVLNRGMNGQPLALTFVPFPMVAWAALRFGATGTSLALIVVSAVAAYGTATGRGPFYQEDTIEGVMLLWFFMATSAALGWMVTALHVARVRTAGIQSLFERALGDVSLGILLAGPDRRITYANVGFTRLTGYSEAELLGKSCSILHGTETDPATVKKAGMALRGDGFFDGEILNYRKDGTTFWNALLISPVHDEQGTKTGFLGVQRDITERKQAEAALNASSEFNRSLIDSMQDGFSVLDARGVRLEVNPAFCRMTGFSREELIGAGPPYPYWPPEDHGRAQAALDEVLKGNFANSEVMFMRRNGERFPVIISPSGIKNREGKFINFLATIKDISERKQAEIARQNFGLKMQETQKLESLGVLAGGIAHDFNNILTAILGNASLALAKVAPGSPVHECLDQISQSSLRAAELCKQMLAYSGRGRFVVRRLDLGQLIAETTQMLQISISKKAVLRFRPAPGLPPVEADPTQMRQVIMNLVINASDAIGDTSGIIDVSTSLVLADRAYLSATMMAPELPEGDYVALEVSDNGCGMSAEVRAKIFDPFFTTKFTGRGLGLAAVLGIVRGHRGAMKVYSEPGRGSTFKLLFPAANAPSEAAPSTPAIFPDWVGEGTALVVDDEVAVRSAVAQMLTAMGLEPVLATDGLEGVEMFRAEPGRFSFVLLDLTMPKMDGAETFAELRRLRADIPVVLMSGFNEQEALSRFAGKGITGFIQKPFALDSLRAVIRGVLT